MPPRHFLYSFAGPVVADTSVIINLNATGRSKDLLAALPNQVVVAEQVVSELQDERSIQHDDGRRLSELIALDLVEVAGLEQNGYQVFADLVSGAAATTLDDGEAATIAAAQERGGLALIDERKALRMCAARFPKLQTASTLDLLRHPRILETLPREDLADAVFHAAYRARMRLAACGVPVELVQHHHGEWVLDLIGRERASACTSLKRILRSTRPRAPLPSSEVHEQRGFHGFGNRL